MLGHRLRRWPNIDHTLDQRLVLAGLLSCFFCTCITPNICILCCCFTIMLCIYQHVTQRHGQRRLHQSVIFIIISTAFVHYTWLDCANAKLIFVYQFLVDIQPSKHETLIQCWFNVGPADDVLTLNTHLINVSCLLGRSTER